MKTEMPDDVRAVASDPRRIAAINALSQGRHADADLDALAGLAAGLLGTPVSLVTIVDDVSQWFTGRHGTELRQTPVEQAFCAHAIADPDHAILVVPDATIDPRFSSNPLVTGDPGIRFYAGVPLVVNAQPIGTLCVIDVVPRPRPDDRMLEQLSSLARLAASLIRLKDREKRGSEAETEIVRVNRRHELAIRAASIATWEMDIETGVVEADAQLRAMFGLDSETGPSRENFLGLIVPDDAERVGAAMKSAIEQGTEFSVEFQIASTGRRLAGIGQVLELPGKRKTFVGINIDVTDRHLQMEKERKMLLEINHRVKNTLAVLQSLAVQTLRRSRDPAHFIDAFSGRIQAIAAVHTLLTDSKWHEVDLATLVSKLGSLSGVEGRILLSENAGRLVLTADEALGIGLILREAISNARNHGALSVPGGMVTSSVSDGGPRRTGTSHIVWQESGTQGLPDRLQEGFGMVLIRRSLDKVLGSSVSVNSESNGMAIRIGLPPR